MPTTTAGRSDGAAPAPGSPGSRITSRASLWFLVGFVPTVVTMTALAFEHA